MKIFILSVLIFLRIFSASQAEEWMKWDVSQGVPSNQIPRGREANYMALYIIRANYNGDLLPGKFNPDFGRAYVPYNGREQIVDDFEVISIIKILCELFQIFIYSFLLKRTSSGNLQPMVKFLETLSLVDTRQMVKIFTSVVFATMEQLSQEKSNQATKFCTFPMGGLSYTFLSMNSLCMLREY